jgi:hypothetical protein
LVDVDLDSPEARLAAPYILPPTEAVFGRVSTPRSHWLYQTEEIVDTRQFADSVTPANDGKERMLVELRSGNRSHQTMFPPAFILHPVNDLNGLSMENPPPLNQARFSAQ